MKTLKRFVSKEVKSLKNVLSKEVSSSLKEIHIVTISKANLIANLGVEIGSAMFKDIKSNGLKQIKGSKGIPIPSIQRLTAEDLNIKDREHLYYSRGDSLAIVVNNYNKAKLRINNMLEHVAEDLGATEGTEGLAEEKEALIKVGNTTTNTFIEVESKYQIKASHTVGLAKQIAKFTNEVTVLTPLNTAASEKKLLNSMIKETTEYLRLPDNELIKSLSDKLEFMNEKRPKATSKSSKSITKTSKSGTKAVRSPVKVKVSEVKTRKIEESNNIIAGILTALNAELAEAIKRRMHKSGDTSSKRYLRYQTGRFAESASVTNVKLNARSITAFYNYQLNPYQVFDPIEGNAKWASRGRDPSRIIGNAIRDILKSEFARGNTRQRRIFTSEAV